MGENPKIKLNTLMIIFIFSMSVISVFPIVSYGNIMSNGEKVNEISLADMDATNSTKNLFNNLKNIAPDKLLFGHQDSTLYGLNYNGTLLENEINRSDVKGLLVHTRRFMVMI